MVSFLIKRFIKDYKNTQDLSIRASYGNLAGIICIVCNILLFALKLAVGLISGSIAIMADAFNNLSDASTNIVAIIGFKLSKIPADKEHPFGHARYEYISSFVVAAIIIFIGFEFSRDSIAKIIEPQKTSFDFILVFILISSMLIKLWMMHVNRQIDKIINSSVLAAAASDSRNDAVATGVILLGAVISHFCGIVLDGWLGLMVALFILYSGIMLIKETVSLLLGESIDSNFAMHIHEKILSYDKVSGVHDLLIHEYGPGIYFASVHIEMDCSVPVLESHDIIDNIEREFREKEHIFLTVHYDPILVGDEKSDSAKRLIVNIVKEISPYLSIHDFRMVYGIEHCNLIFDLVMPFGFELAQSEIEKMINDRLKKEEIKYYTVITFDTDYVQANK